MKDTSYHLTIALVVCAVVGVEGLQAQDPKPTEYQVKAVYLYNFGRFVTWPVRATAGDEPFGVCVLGQDPFGPILDAAVAGETIDRAHVVVRRLAKPQEAASCRVLFISSSQNDDLKEILIALDKQSVLTVSDMPQFVRRGGMIQFLLDGNRVRFEVNLAAAGRAGLNLSSEVLRLATNVRRTP